MITRDGLQWPDGTFQPFPQDEQPKFRQFGNFFPAQAFIRTVADLTAQENLPANEESGIEAEEDEHVPFSPPWGPPGDVIDDMIDQMLFGAMNLPPGESRTFVLGFGMGMPPANPFSGEEESN